MGRRCAGARFAQEMHRPARARKSGAFSGRHPGLGLAWTWQGRSGMQTEPHITFHQLPHSSALEADVRRCIDELDQLYDRLTGCRVVISVPHRHHQKAPSFDVHIELMVPGEELVVTHSGEARAEHGDAHQAVREAFRIARRRLEDFLHRRAALATGASRTSAT
jgi:ribosome-associated translation inhibitor RaiA